MSAPGQRLVGKVAIVTGGASGIGAATLRRFAAEGAAVVCADVDEAGGARVVAEIEEAGGRAAFRRTDVGVLADLEGTVALAVERFGGLDVMHNNAVWSGGGYVAEIDPEVWDRSMQVSLTGVFYGMRAAIPALLARGGGSIITTSSVDGLFGEIMAAPYATAKAAVINLTRTVAVEYGRRGIRANCICPGRWRRLCSISSASWRRSRVPSWLRSTPSDAVSGRRRSPTWPCSSPATSRRRSRGRRSSPMEGSPPGWA